MDKEIDAPAEAIDNAEFIKQFYTETPEETAPAPEVKEPTAEEKARESGWVPKEEFKGPEELWATPEEFIARAPIYKHLKRAKQQQKKLEQTVDALSRHYSTTIEQAKAEAVRNLMEQRKEAIELGEVQRVDQIEQKLHQIKTTPAPVTTAPPIPAPVEDFVEKQSSWFQKDPEMTQFAIDYNEASLAAMQRKGIKVDDAILTKSLQDTLDIVKLKFPDKFVNERRTTPAAVESGAKPADNPGKYNINRLTKEQKLVYNQLVVQHKQMTPKEYFNSLESAGFLEA